MFDKSILVSSFFSFKSFWRSEREIYLCSSQNHLFDYRHYQFCGLLSIFFFHLCYSENCCKQGDNNTAKYKHFFHSFISLFVFNYDEATNSYHHCDKADKC